MSLLTYLPPHTDLSVVLTCLTFQGPRVYLHYRILQISNNWFNPLTFRMESHKVVVIYYFLAFYKVKVGILLNFDFGYFWK